MNSEQLSLWQRLDSLDLDGDAALSFSKRLARDNGWTCRFALRVVGEYKRFLFLAATAGHPVTPSDEVDQAWHLHLVYTRSYWDELCGEILGFPLHHGPTKGGRVEGAKFENWYERTRSSYREEFGEEPPRDVWPDARVRFGEATSFRRVNLKRVWIVPKVQGAGIASALASAPRGLRLAPALVFLVLAGCAEAQSEGPNVFNWHGEPFLEFFWTSCALGIGFGLWRKKRSLSPVDALFPVEPLDAYEVARLRDGQSLATEVALATLWEKGAIEVTPTRTFRATGQTSAPLHAFEDALLRRISTSSATGESSASDARRPLEAVAAMDEKLRALGLLVSRDVRQRADRWPLGITLGLLLIGGIKIVVGLSRDRPVGFLALSCAVLAGFLFFLISNPARRSKRGDLFLEHLREIQGATQPQSFRVHRPASYDAERGAKARNTSDYDALSLGFALAGVTAFAPEIQRVLRPPTSGGDGGSGADGGGSDGGGGGGGCGGGGCGGCGGH